MLVVISSLLAPILLKFAFKGEGGGSLMPPADGNAAVADNAEETTSVNPDDEQTVGSLEPAEE